MENRMIIHGTISRGVKEAFIRDKQLLLVMTDGQELVLGKVVGEDGANGMSLVLADSYDDVSNTVLVIRDAIKDTTLTLPHGKSAYQVAQGQGFGGTEMQWLKSLIGPKGEDGISPTWAVEDIDGGHRVTVTDKDGAKSFDVRDGKDGQGGGTGGTTDYNQLSNKPAINGTALTGNQTAAQLGLATPSDIPGVDTTLTQSGQAADAKTVGDKLKTKQDKFETVEIPSGKALYFAGDVPGVYIENETQIAEKPVLTFLGTEGDERVILRGIDDPAMIGDAASKGYVDAAIANAIAAVDAVADEILEVL